MRTKFLLAGIGLCLGLSLSGCSSGIVDVNSSNPRIAEQSKKVQGLRDQVKDQKQVVTTEQAKLKALNVELEGAERNLKGRDMATKL